MNNIRGTFRPACREAGFRNFSLALLFYLLFSNLEPRQRRTCPPPIWVWRPSGSERLEGCPESERSEDERRANCREPPPIIRPEQTRKPVIGLECCESAAGPSPQVKEYIFTPPAAAIDFFCFNRTNFIPLFDGQEGAGGWIAWQKRQFNTMRNACQC